MAFAADGHVIDGRYRLERWIARGGFGEVWQATDTVLCRPVAVKLLRADRAADPEVLARFRVEARRASGITHENIARIFDYNDAVGGQAPFLVTEFVDGQSLGELLAEGPLTAAATLDIVAQVAAGIAAAHAAGLVGLDIKPANVLLSADGAVKVTDFGIGQLTSDERAGQETGCVTHAYLAPERVLGEAGTPAADLYSLGVLAHECLRGEPPFTGTPIQVAVAHQVRDLPPLPATVPPAVAELILELTDRDPANRPESAAVVARRAAALRQQLVPPVPVPPPVPAAPPTPAKSPIPATFPPSVPATAGQALAHQTLVDHAFADRRFSGRGPAGRMSAGRMSAGRGPGDRGPGGQASAQRSRRRLALIPPAVVVVAVSALLLAGRLDHGSLPAQSAVQAGPATVRVNGAALVNKPVGFVDSRLRRLGLVVRNRWRRSARVPVGLVIAVRPAGRVPVGSLVTVLGSAAAGGAGRVTSSAPVGDRNHPHKGKHGPHPGPSGKPGDSPTPSSPPSPTSPSPTSSASPPPTPTVSPSPSGAPSPAPTPSQSPTSDPTPSGAPGGTGAPSPTASPPPSSGPAKPTD
jgi:eukaryotic-like serine/threonine-protein kinase